MNEISAKNLMGMPVFSINEGEEFGHIRQLIMDPAAKQLLAIVISGRGRCKDTKIVSAGKIVGIGSDAVTISEKGAVARAANLPRMIKYMHRPDNILGNKIISENGYNLGKAEGYYLNTADGSISRLDIAAGSRTNIFAGKCRISGKHILTIGPSAIVLSRRALDDMEQIESPLRINLQSAKQKAEKAAEITLDRSRKISRAISEKLNERNEAKEQAKPDENPSAEPAGINLPLDTSIESEIEINPESESETETETETETKTETKTESDTEIQTETESEIKSPPLTPSIPDAAEDGDTAR